MGFVVKYSAVFNLSSIVHRQVCGPFPLRVRQRQYLYKHLPVKTKLAFLSRKSILLAILLHGQFIHYTKISLHPNIHFFTAKQRAYQSFFSYFLVRFCLHPSGMLGKC